MNDFLEIGHIARIVRRRWWALLLTTLLAALVGYVFSASQTKTFRAATSLIISPTAQATTLDRFDIQLSQDLAGMYADFAERQPVLQAVVDALQLEQSWQALRSQVRVEPVEATQMLEIHVDATSPEQAVAIADEVARQLVLLSSESFNRQADDETDEFVRQRLVHLQENIETGQRRLDTLEANLAEYVGASIDQLRQLQGEIGSLETLVATWEGTYASLYKSLRGEPSPNRLRVFERAQANPDPIRPRVKLNVLIAALFGFTMGFGLVFLLEFADNTLRSADDVVEALRLDSLGGIRRVSGLRIDDMLVANQDKFSGMAEDCRLLRSKLLFLSKEWPRKVFLITSPAPAEGKSLMVANLGIVFASTGLKTVIVDANLRNPIQHKLFHLRQTNGLTDEIQSPQSQLPHRLKKTKIENLLILTSGSLTSASPDRLATDRMTELFSSLAAQVDIILCDAPEAVSFADTPVLADKANGVLLVIDAGHTHRDSARQAVHNLRQTGANLLGFVLNRASAQTRAATSASRGPSVTVGQLVDEQAPAEL